MKDIYKQIGNISNETHKQQISDQQLHKSIVSRLAEVYGKTDERKSIFRRLARNDAVRRISVNDLYKRGSSVRNPWIDHDINSRICNADSALKSPLPRDIGQTDIERSLKKSVARFCTQSPNLSRRDIRAITSAGYCAAQSLGFISGSKAQTAEPDFVIKETAKDTNSGWPKFGRKNSTSVKADTLNWLKGVVNRPTVYSIFNNPILSNPSYKFNRFQPKLNDDNTEASWSIREVWCLPYRIIALECYFFYNLVKRYKDNNVNTLNPLTNAGLGTHEVGLRIIKRLRDQLFVEDGKCLWSTDYVKFDSTIPDVATDIFFNIWGEECGFDFKTRKLYDILRYYTKKSPVVVENELVIFERGMTSGSYITHIFDTWWNLTLWYLSYHAMQQTPRVRADIQEAVKYIPLIKYKIYDKPFYYDCRNDIALCGDDTIVLTTYEEITYHRSICNWLDMDVGVKFKCCDPSKECYFVGGYWNQNNKRMQTFAYITLHIIARTKYYIADELPFPINELIFHRILSICQDLDNGWEYINRAFGKWKKFRSFLSNNRWFIETRDWPIEEHLTRKEIKFIA